MAWWNLTYLFPLLTKDLIEQASYRRTYIVRFFYAAVLYGAAIWMYDDFIQHGVESGTAVMGGGISLFHSLMFWQSMAIYILMPTLTCGAIAGEKERETLALLLITKLSPWTIVLEKLLSRVVMMGTFQLLSLPLFGIIYGLGGVELDVIVISIVYLFAQSLMIGALGVLCSVASGTTTSALMATYVLALTFLSCFCYVSMPSVGQRISTLTFAVTGIIQSLVMAAVFVCIARAQLVEKAFVPPTNHLLILFRMLDKYFEDLNKQTTGGIVLIPDRDFLPDFYSIAWRETRKKSLGTARYLFRLLAILEGPLILAISWTILDMSRTSFSGPFQFFVAVLWPISALAIIVHSINVLASERSRQTLDLLLVSPLSQRELVTEKLAGVRRLICVLSVPFVTLGIFLLVWNGYVVRGLGHSTDVLALQTTFLDLLSLGLGTVIYLRLIQWIAFHISLRVRNQIHAMLIAVAIIGSVCALPVIYETMAPRSLPRLSVIEWISPVRVLVPRNTDRRRSEIARSESSKRRHGVYQVEMPLLSDWFLKELTGTLLHFAVAGLLWDRLRHKGLTQFSTITGRTEAANSTLPSGV
ncbi:MAG: hypothetical protein FJ267_01240 [Planctomycetes bacterium]|nr:hypothetical protein [Planctomycetota bacterium]